MSETASSARVVSVAAGIQNTGGGLTQVARHASSVGVVTWTASMDVTLRKVT